MKTPATHMELVHAVRELVGPDAHVTVEATIGSYRNGELHCEWRVYVNDGTGAPWSTADVFGCGRQPLTSIWQAVLNRYGEAERPSIEAAQFYAPAEVEAANG